MGKGNPKNWGDWISSLATSRGIRTQSHLAKLVGITPTAMSRLLSSEKPRRMESKTINGLCGALGINQEMLLRAWIGQADWCAVETPYIGRVVMNATSLDEVVRFIISIRPELNPTSTASIDLDDAE